jgi:hypothetical protein
MERKSPDATLHVRLERNAATIGSMPTPFAFALASAAL